MPAAARRISWFGLVLIVFGTLLLLRKLGILDLHVREIVWPLLILVGAVLTARGFASGRRGQILFGTVLFLYSIFFFMRTWGGIFIPFDMIVPATFLIFGIVLLMLFLNRPSEWYFLIPGLFLLAIGVMMVLSEYGYWHSWEVREFAGTWWPAVLILFGLGMLLRRRDSRRAPSGMRARCTRG